MGSKEKKLVSFSGLDDSNTPLKTPDNEGSKKASVSDEGTVEVTLEPSPPPHVPEEEYGAYIYRTVKKKQVERQETKVLGSIVALPFPIIVPSPPPLLRPPPLSLPRPHSAIPQVQLAIDLEWRRELGTLPLKNKADKRMARDFILWKLPIAKLFAVGCVPSFRYKLLHAHKNLALKKMGFLKHNMEYYPNVFDTSSRQGWALHHPSHEWKQMPHLNFLPRGVNKILSGCGGLVLLNGGIQPCPLGTANLHSFALNCDSTTIQSNHWVLKCPPQPMLVVVNPIVRSYFVLPPLEEVLTHVLARIVVSALSDSYVIHLVGWKKTHNHTTGILKVGVYNSLRKEWHFHPDLAPNQLLLNFFQPDFVFASSLRNFCMMLPMVSSRDGWVIFIVGTIEVMSNELNGERRLEPTIMRYIFQKRSWESHSWPLAETMERPQIVECESVVYFVSRTLIRPRTLHIYKLEEYGPNQAEEEFIKGSMNLIEVSTMKHDMYNKCFTDFNSVDIDTKYYCVGGMECVWIMCHTLPVMVYYNMRRKHWDYIPSIPMFEPGKTVIGNWMYQPSIHAQVL